MAAYFHGSLPLSKHTSIEQTVKSLIVDLKEKKPEAEVIRAEVFLDGMSAHVFVINVDGVKLQVNFAATSTDNMPGWVRLVYGEGIYESVTKPQVNMEEHFSDIHG